MLRTNYTGISSELIRFVETEQLKDRAMWKLVADQFRKGNVDDADKGWRGEYWGKLMRGACMTWQCTGDEELYEILTETVKDLLTTQDEQGRFSTYTTDAEFHGWDMWSRKYILLGLIHFYEICKEEELKKQVLDAASRHLDYVVAHIGERANQKVITQTSDLWLGINSSSILEPVVRLYKLTQKKEYLDFASYIVENGGAEGFDIFEAAYENKLSPYEYPVVKAYELMSCFEGLIEYYRVTGIEKWKVAAVNFAERLIETEATIVGGSGCEHELFNYSALKQTFGEYKGLMLETCVTVTWMKLMYAMYQLTGDACYLDEIECSTYNALYGAVNVERSTCGPETTFDEPHYRGVYDLHIANKGGKGQVFDSYSPLMTGIRGRAVGGMKTMENNTTFCGCCIAIGAAGTALVELAAARETTDGVEIGLYLPGQVETDGLTLSVNTTYPADGNVEITVLDADDKEREIALRMPAFADGSTVSVNGDSVDGVIANGFLRLNRKWEVNDKIVLELAMNPRLVFGMHNPEDAKSEKRMAVLYGPLALARDKRLGEVGTVLAVGEKKLELKALDVDTIGFPCQVSFEVNVDGNQFTMIDYASAGKTWRRDSEMEAWMETK